MALVEMSTTERAFFVALANAVFGDPFAVQRAELVAQLALNAKPADPIADREALSR